MGKLVTIDEYLSRLSERVVDNSRQLKKGVRQRRNGMEDLYGVEFTHNGDANHPATFYISISPDLVYYERFDFKFIIGAYESAVAGIDLSGEGMTIGETSLSVSGSSGSEVISGTSTLDDATVGSITPNPHTHTLGGGSISGQVTYGINQISTSSANWRVEIHGIDITDYLIEQHDGRWISGEGIYPNNRVETKEDFYDILDVACMMSAEGRAIVRLSNIRDANIVDMFFGVQIETLGRYTYAILPVPWDGNSIENSVDENGNITIVISLRAKLSNTAFTTENTMSFSWLQQVRRKLSYNC